VAGLLAAVLPRKLSEMVNWGAIEKVPVELRKVFTETHGNRAGELVMTEAERLMAEGEKRGLERGVKQGVKQGLEKGLAPL